MQNTPFQIENHSFYNKAGFVLLRIYFDGIFLCYILHESILQIQLKSLGYLGIILLALICLEYDAFGRKILCSF
jgi:hypothetical protein